MSALCFICVLYITIICITKSITYPPITYPQPYPTWTQPSITPITDVGISLLSQGVEITVEDRYAFISYWFFFLNQNNDISSASSSQLEYEISLQPNTFISHFSADLNGIIFIGQTKERLQATNEYNNAVESGLNAVLVSQDHDANTFNIKMNIEKGGYAELNIIAETFMLRRFGYYELSLLTTNIYSSSNIHSEFTETPISINLFDESQITYTDVITPNNANHNINQITNNQYTINIILQRSLTMRQELILLRYKTQTSNDINQLLYNDESQTFLHIFSYEHQSTILPRRVVFVLDRSGSMGINKWQSAVTATIGAIQDLKPDIDKMNIILFDHVSLFYSPIIVSVTRDIINDAINWINGYNSRGSTNIYQAVADAIDLIKYDTVLYNSEFTYVNQIVLVTDGKPTAGITNPIQIQNGLYDFNNQQLQSAPASIFCLGIGDDIGDQWVRDLNYPLLRSIATQNEGFDAMIRASQTENILSQYYNILKSPVLTYIILDYNSYTTNIENINQNNIHNLTKNKYRNLYAGTDIVIAGKLFVQNSGIIISLFGRSSGGNIISNTYPIEFNRNNNIIIDRIWAYLRLKMYQSLLDNPRLSTMNIMLYNLLENSALNLALKYKLVTPWTSMIVVDESGNTNQITQSQMDTQTQTYAQPQWIAPQLPSIQYSPPIAYGIPVAPMPPMSTVSSDCNIYNNDASNCMKQILSNGNQKCEYNAVNRECSLIVQLNAFASHSDGENSINNELVISEVEDEHKPVIFILMGVTICVLICLLSGMIVGLCYHCKKNKKNKNKQMEMLVEINNV